jgi:quercetin dioxygenase-like cupin family protein
MAILEGLTFVSCDDPDDRDDYRPASSWAVAADPGDTETGRVEAMSLSVDVVAPGDRVPLHVHPIDEVVLVVEGVTDVTLGASTRTLQPGAIVFIPAGIPHGGVNVGDVPVRFVGMFSTDRVPTTYLERNPAPGTEGDPPQPGAVIDVRALMNSSV